MATDKDILVEKMGSKFVDAIYEGTTDETLTKNFNKALRMLAEFVLANGTITIERASQILAECNPENEYRPHIFVGYASAGNSKLNNENLVKFEKEYFSVPSRYPHLRFGQALVHVFDLPKKLEDYIFYDVDTSHVREVVWMEVNGITEPKNHWES